VADDEQPSGRGTRSRGGGSWTGLHRSADGRFMSRRGRPMPEPEEPEQLIDAEVVGADPAPRDPGPSDSVPGDSALDWPALDGPGPEDVEATTWEVDEPTSAHTALAGLVPGTRSGEPLPLDDQPDRADPADSHAWLDHEAGPVVRPYTLTGGRSEPAASGLGLLTHVESLYAPDADTLSLQPEHREILNLTRTALSVAELAARLDLPVGVVGVVVGDLVQRNLVSTFEAGASTRPPDDEILLAVINGLRAL
jgi:hypothetical protein